MKQTYIFSDWTSVSKMRNEINSRLKLDVGVLRDESQDKINGYKVTVYDCKNNKVIYRFYVDNFEETNWSLSTDYAVEVLNKIGFPCRYDSQYKTIPNYAIQVLNLVSVLGYTHIWKGTDGDIFVGFRLNENDTRFIKTELLSEIVIDLDDSQFSFLDSTPTRVLGLINSGGSPE